jgi:hypothetical protein
MNLKKVGTIWIFLTNFEFIKRTFIGKSEQRFLNISNTIKNYVDGCEAVEFLSYLFYLLHVPNEYI